MTRTPVPQRPTTRAQGQRYREASTTAVAGGLHPPAKKQSQPSRCTREARSRPAGVAFAVKPGLSARQAAANRGTLESQVRHTACPDPMQAQFNPGFCRG
jgi:hypothetical protein